MNVSEYLKSIQKPVYRRPQGTSSASVAQLGTADYLKSIQKPVYRQPQGPSSAPKAPQAAPDFMTMYSKQAAANEIYQKIQNAQKLIAAKYPPAKLAEMAMPGYTERLTPEYVEAKTKALDEEISALWYDICEAGLDFVPLTSPEQIIERNAYNDKIKAKEAEKEKLWADLYHQEQRDEIRSYETLPLYGPDANKTYGLSDLSLTSQWGIQEKAKFLVDPEYQMTALALSPQAGGSRDYVKLNLMTNDEKKVLLYYASQNQWDKAEKYYNLLSETLDARWQTQKSQKDQAFFEDHPVLGAAANVASSFLTPLAVVGNGIQAVENLFTGEHKPTNQNSEWFAAAHMQQDSMAGVQAAAYNAALKSTGSEKAAEIASFSAGTGLSILNFGSKAWMGPAALAYMGADAAGNQTLESLQAGGSPGQALLFGIAAGAIEIATEKIPLDNLFDLAKGGVKGVKKALVPSMLKQGGMEFTEESISQLANTIVDIGVMGEKSGFQQYVDYLVTEKGYSESDAYKEALLQYFVKDVGMAGLSGFVSGNLTGGSASVYGNVKNALKSNMLNATQPISSVNDFKQIIPQDTRQDSSTSVDTDPDIHTPVEQKIIDDYQSSVDENLVQFINYSLENKGSNSGKYVLKPVSSKAVSDIKSITGVDTTGFKTVLEQRMVEHIINRHGVTGAADQSMSDINDIARMQYVLDHYDSMFDGGNVNAYTTNKKNGKPGLSQSVIYQKAVNGVYYVVQAVPNTKAKTTYIVSAYLTESGNSKAGASQIADASHAPSLTSDNAYANTPAINTIPQNVRSVKYQDAGNIPGAESGNTRSAPQPGGMLMNKLDDLILSNWYDTTSSTPTKWPETPEELFAKNSETGYNKGAGDKADLLTHNRAQGRAYEQKSFAEFSKNYMHAQEQITIKTPSSTRTRLDAIGLDAEGNVVINEVKSSETAPLTQNQKIAFPEIFNSGGMVVGRGKGIFSGGYTIPVGTDIKIIRPPK